MGCAEVISGGGSNRAVGDGGGAETAVVSPGDFKCGGCGAERAGTIGENAGESGGGGVSDAGGGDSVTADAWYRLRGGRG